METLIAAFICWVVACVALGFRERIVTEFREGWVAWWGNSRGPMPDTEARCAALSAIALFFSVAILVTVFGIAEVVS